MMSGLENRMFNILRKNPIGIACTSGKYKAALGRLVKKGAVVRGTNHWDLSVKSRIEHRQ